MNMPKGIRKFFSSTAAAAAALFAKMSPGEVGGCFVVKVDAEKRVATVKAESGATAQAYKNGSKKPTENEVAFYYKDGDGKSFHAATLAATTHCTKLNDAFKHAKAAEKHAS